MNHVPPERLATNSRGTVTHLCEPEQELAENIWLVRLTNSLKGKNKSWYWAVVHRTNDGYGVEPYWYEMAAASKDGVAKNNGHYMVVGHTYSGDSLHRATLQLRVPTAEIAKNILIAVYKELIK